MTKLAAFFVITTWLLSNAWLFATDSKEKDPLKELRFNFRGETACPICFETYAKEQVIVFSSCIHAICEICFDGLPEPKTCAICRIPHDVLSEKRIKFETLNSNASILWWPLCFNSEYKMLDILALLNKLLEKGELADADFLALLTSPVDKHKTILACAQAKNWKKLEQALIATQRFPKHSPLPDIIVTKIQNICVIANHKTWSCHWFPLKETMPGGDPINNLYAHGGCLDKLDKLSKKKRPPLRI